MHEDKGVGTLKSIVFVPFLDEITTTSGGSSGNRRATSGNLRGRAENGEETTLGVGTTRAIFVNRLQGVLRLLLGSRIRGLPEGLRHGHCCPPDHTSHSV
jgi:hypothetical protein